MTTDLFKNERVKALVKELIQLAIREDIQNGDHTTLATIPEDAKGKALLVAKEKGIICGVQLADFILEEFDSSVNKRFLKKDGTTIEERDEVLELEGPIRSILTIERLILNFFQYLSGITTKTNYLVGQIAEYPAQILDTRKTTPGMRMLEKWAVAVGGAKNHRFGLYDGIIIKDNHVDYAGSMEWAIKNVETYLKNKGLRLPIVVEARNLTEVRKVLEIGGVDQVLLDNMENKEIFEAVKLIDGKFKTEASGGILAKDLKALAETGVDFISTSALTRDIHSLDLSLNLHST